MKPYHCTNCGRDFEAEEKEIIECPQCYWTSSVKAADEAGERKPAAPTAPVRERKAARPFNWGKTAGILLLAAAVGGVIYFLPAILRTTASLMPGEKKQPAIEIKMPGAAPSNAQSETAPAALTAEEEALLLRKADIAVTVQPDENQQRILSRDVPFKTGVIERLPSQVWDFALFEKTLDEQIARYKVGLPRSYRKKLEQHFQETYQAGADDFMEGRLLDARNAWVRTLAFPLYSQDLQKHRGVALTLLRPFINDVLSKVGAVNTMLVDSGLRSQEQQIRTAYQEFRQLLIAGSWQESISKADNLLAQIRSFESQNTSSAQAPPYPQEITGIDQGIAVSLFDLLKPAQASTADLTLIVQDVKQKQETARQLIPANRAAQIQLYEQGLEAIRLSNWQAAESALKQVAFPENLKQDAAQKLKLIQKVSASKS